MDRGILQPRAIAFDVELSFPCSVRAAVLVSSATVHRVHSSLTKLSILLGQGQYRYHVLKGEVQKRCRELIIQICDAEDIRILKGAVSKDHVHMHVEYSPSKSISEVVKRLKGRPSRVLQQEYPELEKRYWGKHFWAIGYGAWSTGNITEELVEEYLEHHRTPSNMDRDSFILE